MSLPEPDSYLVTRTNDTADIEHTHVTDATTVEEAKDAVVRDAARWDYTLGEWEAHGVGLNIPVLEYGEPSNLSYQIEPLYD